MIYFARRFLHVNVFFCILRIYARCFVRRAISLSRYIDTIVQITRSFELYHDHFARDYNFDRFFARFWSGAIFNLLRFYACLRRSYSRANVNFRKQNRPRALSTHTSPYQRNIFFLALNCAEHFTRCLMRVSCVGRERAIAIYVNILLTRLAVRTEKYANSTVFQNFSIASRPIRLRFW